jgi:hypothetical protein
LPRACGANTSALRRILIDQFLFLSSNVLPLAR